MDAPLLIKLNGMGFGMRSHRNDDPATGDYESSLYFYFLWIPLFALKAYRVKDAENGAQFFLEKVALSSDDRLYNASVGPLLTIVLAVLIYWVNQKA